MDQCPLNTGYFGKVDTHLFWVKNGYVRLTQPRKGYLSLSLQKWIIDFKRIFLPHLLNKAFLDVSRFSIPCVDNSKHLN